MCLDKIHTLRTGVSLEISTTVLHELIAKAINRHELSGLAAIHSPADLHEYLSVIVYSGAEELVLRRQRCAVAPVPTAAERPNLQAVHVGDLQDSRDLLCAAREDDSCTTALPRNRAA